MSLSWPGALRSPKIKATEGGIKRWGFLQRGMSSGKGCQQPVSLCSSRRELCPWCRGKAGIWEGRRGGIPGDGASCAPHLPRSCGRLLPEPEQGRAAPHRPGHSRGDTGPPSKGRSAPHHPIHGHHSGTELQTSPRGPGLGANPGEQTLPRGKGRPPPSLGENPPPLGHPQPRAAGMRPKERTNAPGPARPPLTGAGPTQPSPHWGGTPPCPPSPLPSSLTAGRGELPVPGGGGGGSCAGGRAGEGGRGRRRLRQCRSMARDSAGQPRKRGRGGGGGHGATSHPAAEVAGARARAAGARPGGAGGTTASGGGDACGRTELGENHTEFSRLEKKAIFSLEKTLEAIESNL